MGARFISFAGVGIVGAMLTACSAGNDAIDAALKRALPPMPAYTAVGVISCSGQGDETECRGCEVVAFGPDFVDGAVEATRSDYDLRVNDDGELRVVVQGGAYPVEDFDHDGTLDGARAALEEARAWCEAQGARRWLVDRDELTQAYEGDA